MKKIYQWTLAAMFTLCSTAVLTSCSSNDDDNNTNGTDNGDTEVAWVEPTTDQMAVRVTVDLSPASLSQFPETSTGAALIRRLPQVTANITDDTDFVLLKGSDVTSLSADVMKQLAIVLDKGGYVAIEKPTVGQLDYFMDKIDAVIAAYVEEYTEELFDVTPEQMQATISASMAGRMALRQKNLSNFTRGATDDDIAAELIIFGPTETYLEDPLDTESQVTTFITDTDGNLQGDKTNEQVSWTITDYNYGQIADGAADWLNDVESSFDDQEDDLYGTADAATRSAISRASDLMTGVNDVANATETFTHSGSIFFGGTDYHGLERHNRVVMTLHSWSSHNVSTNKDYYYVRENVLLRMGLDDEKDKFDPFYCRYYSDKDWMKEMTSENGVKKPTGKWWYGHFLTQYEASMNLTGVNTITCEAATPETANQVVTKAVTTTQSTGSTTDYSVSSSYSLGLNGGSLSANFSLEVSAMSGVTKGNSFAMANTRSVKDLKVTKNTEGSKVTWTYTGRLPKATLVEKGVVAHDKPADILVNDANLVNDACWSVSDPKGRYTLTVGSIPSTGALVYDPVTGRQDVIQKSLTGNTDWDVTLMQPNRAIQNWRMFVTVNEWEDSFRMGAQSELVSTISKKFPDLYKSVFSVGEIDKNSLSNASAIIRLSMEVFDVYKDILQAIAKSYGIKKFTIVWSSDKSLETKKGYVVTVN